MQTLDFNQFHPFIKLAFTFFIMFLSYLALTIVGMMLAMPIFHLNVQDILQLLSSNLQLSNVVFLKYSQFIQSLGFFVIPGLIVNYFFRSNKSLYFHINRKPDLNIIFLVLFSIFASVPFINLLLDWNMQLKLPEFLSGVEVFIRQMEDNAGVIMDKLLATENGFSFAFNLVLIALLPAIGEEFIFRGIFQQIFKEWFKNKHLAVAVTAILFSAFHFQFYGFLPRMALGFYFGYLFFLCWGV